MFRKLATRFDYDEWLDHTMKKWAYLILYVLLALFSWQSFAEADVTLPAGQLRSGCFVVMHKMYSPSIDQNVNANVFDLQILWKCPGAEIIQIGKINAEGVGPEVVTVFYRPNEIVVLARWTSGSDGADFEGYFYQVNAYRLEQGNGKIIFKRELEITKAFGDGYDGILDGKRVNFPYKNAAAIRSHLAKLGL